MNVTIQEILGFENYHETDSTLDNIADMTAIIKYTVINHDEEDELQEWVTTIRPGENSPWSFKIIEVAEEWRANGGVIEPYRPIATNDWVNQERFERIRLGCVINGVYLRGEASDRENLSNLAQVAQMRLTQGDDTTITKFRDGNNTIHDLIPSQVVALWTGGLAYIDSVYQASWAIKDGETDGVDPSEDHLWPDNGLTE